MTEQIQHALLHGVTSAGPRQEQPWSLDAVTVRRGLRGTVHRGVRTIRRSVLRAAAHPAVPPLALLAGGVAGATYLWDRNPHEAGHLLPRCPFNWATGLLCPACGGTRMAYDLIHGDPAAAFHDNAALLVLGLPAAAYLWGRWLREGLRGRRYVFRLGPRGTVYVVGTAVAWAVVRNVVG